MATSDGPLFPFKDPIAEEVGGRLLCNERWRTWFRNLRSSVDLSQSVERSSLYDNQTATIGITSLDGGTLSAGLYTVSWYMSVVAPAGVSSSAQVTIAWQDDTGSKSFTGAAMNGNTTTTIQGDQRVMLYSLAASPITFAVTYASNPAAAMIYDLRIVLQSVGGSQ